MDTATTKSSIFKTIFLVTIVSVITGFTKNYSGDVITFIPPNDPIAYYPFNGDANDESGSGFHGAVSGATLVEDRFGNVNSAYEFDGINDFIELGSSSNYDSNEGSVSLWFKVNELNTTHYLFSDRPNTSPADDYMMMVVTPLNETEHRIKNSSNGNIYGSIEFQTDTWYHVVLTWGATGMNSYVNGVLDGSDPFTNSWDGSRTMYLGTRAGQENFIDGALDDIRIYDRILSIEEINSLASEGSGLVASYPFNGNANDESGNGHHGTIVDASLTSDRFGNPNSAYHFDGIDDYITIPHDDILNPGMDEYSVTGWFRTSMTDYGAIIAKSNASIGSRNFYYFRIDNLAQLHLEMGVPGDGVNVRPPDTFNDGEWHHFAFVRSVDADDSFSIFADGQELDTQTDPTVLNYFPNDELTIGAYSPYDGSPSVHHFFEGDIDDIAVYKRALSSSEIAAQFTSIIEDTIAYYPFNGNANDESGNGHDGVVNGTTLTIDRFGNPNSAYSFDGADDWIDLQEINYDDFGSYTISAWIRTNDFSSTSQPIINNFSDQVVVHHTNMVSLSIFKSDHSVYPDHVSFLHRDDDNGNGGNYEGGDFVASDQDVIANEWIHLSVVRDVNSNFQRLFLNGQLVDEHLSLSQTPVTETLYWQIGRLYDSSNPPSIHFSGVIDDISIFNYPLSEIEINEIYSEGGWTDSNETDILDMSHSDLQGAPVINDVNHTIEATVSFESDITNLNPTFTLSTGASISPSSGSFQDFSNSISYTVTAENGIESELWTVIISNAPNTETEITDMILDELIESAEISPNMKTVEGVVSFGSSLLLSPEFTLSEGASINPASGSARDFSNPVSYTVTAQDGVTNSSWMVSILLAPNSEAAITGVALPELQSFSLDNENHTISIFVPFGTSLDLAPSFTHSENASIAQNGTLRGFSEPVIYTVVAEDGTQQDWIVTVNILPNNQTEIDSISLVGVNLESFEIDKINHRVNGYVPFGTSLENLNLVSIISENATISPLSGIDRDFTNTVTYTVTAQDGVSIQIWEITISALPNTEAEITGMDFPQLIEGSVQIDFDEGKIYGEVPYDSSLTLSPLFELSDSATIQPSNGSLQDFTDPFYYVVTAQDSSTKEWNVCISKGPDIVHPELSIESEVPETLSVDSGVTTLEISASDNSDTISVTFLYRKIRQLNVGGSWSSEELDGVNGQFQFNLGSHFLDEIGVAWYLKATDPSGNSDSTEIFYTYTVSPELSTVEVPSSFLGKGGTFEDWRMFSIPYELEDNDISKLFEAKLGSYDTTVWRLMHYQDDGVEFIDYKESGFTHLRRGKGYWFNSRKEFDLMINPGIELDLRPGNEQIIELAPGWNQIGNPYHFQINWDEVLAFNNHPDIESSLQKYEGGTNLTATKELSKFEAAYVRNNSNTILQLRVPFYSSLESTTISGTHQTDENWVIPLHLRTGDLVNSVPGIGMAESSSKGRDKNDISRSPRFGNYVDLVFLDNSELSRSVVNSVDSYRWDFQIASNISDDVTVSWNPDELKDLNSELVLFHPESDQRIIMSSQHTFSVRSDQSKSLSILYGEQSWIESSIKESITTIGDPYPNPSDGVFKIDFSLPTNQPEYTLSYQLMDIHGKIISSKNDEKFSSGQSSLTLDFETVKGQPNNGIYILILSLNGKSYTKLISITK